MKSFIVVTLLATSAFALGTKKAPSQDCLKKVVAAVNKQHTLAEGSAYALRVVYAGEFASTLLVGHSDETDPSDYLVTVEKKDCKIKSIVYTNEAIGVEEYSAAEQLENIFRK